VADDTVSRQIVASNSGSGNAGDETTNFDSILSRGADRLIVGEAPVGSSAVVGNDGLSFIEATTNYFNKNCYKRIQVTCKNAYFGVKKKKRDCNWSIGQCSTFGGRRNGGDY
jgi:hypothetical protein